MAGPQHCHDGCDAASSPQRLSSEAMWHGEMWSMGTGPTKRWWHQVNKVPRSQEKIQGGGTPHNGGDEEGCEQLELFSNAENFPVSVLQLVTSQLLVSGLC